MAMSLIIENFNSDTSAYGPHKADLSPRGGSYYNFYQSKLRQLVTQTRYRKQQQVRSARQKTKNSLPDTRLTDQQLHRECVIHARERSKAPIEESFPNKFEEQRKSFDSISSNSSRTPTLSIISSAIESRPKSIVKPRTISIPAKQPRITSAPLVAKSCLNKSETLPTTIKNDPMDDNLSTANIHSFTQVSSSSSSNFNDKARRSILDTIYSHLDSHYPTNVALWPTFEDIDNRFSSSIAPTVYRDFERNTA